MDKQQTRRGSKQIPGMIVVRFVVRSNEMKRSINLQNGIMNRLGSYSMLQVKCATLRDPYHSVASVILQRSAQQGSVRRQHVAASIEGDRSKVIFEI
jgi:hypothetical protein